MWSSQTQHWSPDLKAQKKSATSNALKRSSKRNTSQPHASGAQLQPHVRNPRTSNPMITNTVLDPSTHRTDTLAHCVKKMSAPYISTHNLHLEPKLIVSGSIVDSTHNVSDISQQLCHSFPLINMPHPSPSPFLVPFQDARNVRTSSQVGSVWGGCDESSQWTPGSPDHPLHRTTLTPVCPITQQSSELAKLEMACRVAQRHYQTEGPRSSRSVLTYQMDSTNLQQTLATKSHSGNWDSVGATMLLWSNRQSCAMWPGNRSSHTTWDCWPQRMKNRRLKNRNTLWWGGLDLRADPSPSLGNVLCDQTWGDHLSVTVHTRQIVDCDHQVDVSILWNFVGSSAMSIVCHFKKLFQSPVRNCSQCSCYHFCTTKFDVDPIWFCRLLCSGKSVPTFIESSLCHFETPLVHLLHGVMRPTPVNL